MACLAEHLGPSVPIIYATSMASASFSGAMAQVVIDATGSNKSMSQALGYCGFTGRLVYVGITQQEVVFPHAPVMHRRELTLLASRNALPSSSA